jgi:hypothetical protein
MTPTANYRRYVLQRHARLRRTALFSAAVLPLVILLLALVPARRPGSVAASALDRGPDDWQRSPHTFAERDFPFHPDKICKPPEGQVAVWRRAYPLVRPIPYPYYIGLSVPTDCCSSYLSDLYYFASLLSRRYGLDFPSSFWVFNANSDPYPVTALYQDSHTSLAHRPIDLQRDPVDQQMLLLTSYYRGWLDHLHQWSGESGVFHSLVKPCKVTIASSGYETVDLELGAVLSNAFLGFQMDMEMSGGVHALELELIDAGGESHFVVHGRGLEGRPGWDLTRAPRDGLRSAFVAFAAEANATERSCLGQFGKPHLRAARVRAWGDPGAILQVRKVRPCDLTRACVARQIAALRELNVLPICSTNHGGNSSWSQIDDWNFAIDVTDPVNQHTFQIERPPLAATPSSPSYCADLLDEFGVIFHNQSTQCLPGPDAALLSSQGLLRVWSRADGRKMYLSPRWSLPPTDAYPDVTRVSTQLENLGGNIVRYLASCRQFGQHGILYTHRNFYSPDVFAPATDQPQSLSEVRRLHPHLARALETLACLQYDLDGRRAFYQRVWCCPLSVALRFAQAQRGLAEHTHLDGIHVAITPWRDEVTGRPYPDVHQLSQDLHGQTFYVADAASARVSCGGVEITSLQRNPPDFTGRPSVTVVDTETPTLIFDEVALQESGAVTLDNARLAYPQEEAARGQRCLQICSVTRGTAAVVWTPHRLDNHETEYVHLSYRKTNPDAVAAFSWTDGAGHEYVMTEGKLKGRAGWEIGTHAGSGYREVVVDYADMHGPATGGKAIPRGDIKQVRFALEEAMPGDAVCFDRVEFLSARGLRVDSGGGIVLGGRLSSRADGVTVQACVDGQCRRAVTAHGGWYILTGVPRDGIVEIAAIIEGQRYHPERGRHLQVVRNDLEYHIDVTPRRGRKVP